MAPMRETTWFDTERPVKGYWFCTSGIFSAGGQTSLRQEIAAFFSALAVSKPTLAHLANISGNVEVFGWNDFDGALTAIPPLGFKWFEQLPIGFRPIQSFTQRKTFRRFLDDDTLEFFSRDEFNRETKAANQARLIDERAILSELLDGNERTGLVLTGPGGLGKTRLALEFGRIAERKQWLVLHVERDAQGEAIDELARFYTTSAQVLLIIDYAEAANSLFGLAQAVERVNRDGDHRFRFVATCRASALSIVREAVEESPTRVIDLSGAKGDRYNEWVVNRILDSAKVPHLARIAAVCGGIPAVAAFAVYLFRQYSDEFDAQFGQIHRGEDFAAWVSKRLKLAIEAQGLDIHSTRRLLACLAVRLPLSADDHYVLRSRNDETARLLNLLKDDRWIESDDYGSLSAVHDIFADAIVARYVFEAHSTITDRTGDVVSDAMEAGALDRALVSLERLRAHPKFAEIDGLTVILRIHARNAHAVLAAHRALLRTRIPTDRSTIQVLDALPDLTHSIADDAHCDGLVAHLAESVAEAKNKAWHTEAVRILQPLLDRAVERTRWSNIVVRRALLLSPERYQQDALDWIRRELTGAETHFLFVAWLRSGLPTGPISFELDIWLREQETSAAASFVYGAWLDTAAKLDSSACKENVGKVEAHVLVWLGPHGTSPEAGFVYQSWLDTAAKLDSSACKENVGKVEAHVLAWLGPHGTSPEAQFVYKSWLDAGGSVEVVRALTLAYLAANADHPGNDFVLKAWLEATDDFKAVRDHALQWFKRNRQNAEAVYILKFISRERELPSDAVEDIVVWCTSFPDTLDSVCRIGPVISRFASGALEKPLVDAALLVLNRVNMDWLTDKGVRVATVATIGVLSWKSRFDLGIALRLDDVHSKVLLNPVAYHAALVPETPRFALNPSVAQHVAGMIERRIIDPARHADALERFADWLAAWPPDQRDRLIQPLNALKRNCSRPDLWNRVSVTVPNHTDNGDGNLDGILDKLADLQMRPAAWSYIWEKQGWARFPGEPRLVALARRWLNEAEPAPSWPFVWQPLFLHFPDIREWTDVALSWLEHRGPRDRGAWTFVWTTLWDRRRDRNRLAPLGRAWLDEYRERHRHWTEINDRLNVADE